jgi:predicted ribosomally synthesized peptide with SipW-like signal peptide
MKRSILTSALIIAAAAGLMAIGATQALFNDTQTASGDVNAAPAGSIDLRLNDGTPACGITNLSEDEITFEPFENLLPGESVTCFIELENEGTESFDVDVLGADTSASVLDVCDGAGDDFTITLAKGTDTDGDDPDASTARVAPTVIDTASITVMLNLSASNDCQGDAAFISVAFTAESIGP